MTDLILGALILAPAVLTFVLKSNAGVAFLALCAGFVLSTSAVGDLKHLLNEMDLSVAETTLALILVTAPFLITLLLVRGGAKKGVQFFLQLAVALAGGGLLALSIAPLINASDFDLDTSTIWKTLQDTQAAIVGAGALLSLALVWLSSFSHHKKHK